MYKLEDFKAFMNNAKHTLFAVKELEERLLKSGYIKLQEGTFWSLEAGKNYFLTRSDSSLIAFKVPTSKKLQFKILMSHTDSPTFKLKENYLIKFNNEYDLLDVEKYGGATLSTWLDRDISICGRVLYREDNKIKTGFYDLGKKIVIANIAPHLKQDLNNGYKYQVSKDIRPMLKSSFSLEEDIKKQLNIKGEILGRDLYLYDTNRINVCGVEDELLSCQGLDDLACAYSILMAFIDSKEQDSVDIYASFDNEEVGSLSTNGAFSTFLNDVCHSIAYSLGYSERDYLTALANSYAISADNAHALNNNYREVFDSMNAPELGKGIVIKESASFSYATTGFSKALLRYILDKNGVKYQFFANNSDIRGGSTLGPLLLNNISVNTIDIGLAQLAMHSIREVIAASDLEEMYKAIKAFLETSFKICGDEIEF